MDGKKGNDPEFKPLLDTFKVVLEKISFAVLAELHTVPGKVNFLFDILLAIIATIFALSTSISSIARIIASTINPELTKNTGDNTIFGLLWIVIGFWVICLIFMMVIERTWNERDNNHST